MKMSIRVILFCICLCCIISVSGCEDAPTDNNDTTNESVTIQQYEKFVTLKEAKEEINTIKGKKVNGFIFPEYFNMPDTDSITVAKLLPWKEIYSDMYINESTLEHIWNGYKKADWSLIEEKKFPNTLDKDYMSIMKEDNISGCVYSLDTDGFFCGDSGCMDEMSDTLCIKSYDFMQGDTASKKDIYNMKDGEISVYNAVVYTEKLLNNNLSNVEDNQFTYKVQQLDVLADRDGSLGYNCFNMIIGRIYNGTDINVSSDFYRTNKLVKPYDKIHGGTNILAIMNHKNKLDYINMLTESFGATQISSNEKIISPLWAVQMAGEQVAHTGNISFNRCGLIYVLEQDRNGDGMEKTSNNETYLRPVWLFAKKGPSGQDYKLSGNLGESIMIDAIDGTLYYYETTI